MSATAFQRLRREQAAKAAKVNEETPVNAVSELTNKELKAMLDAKGVEYDAKANKATLLKLLEGAE